MYIYENEIAQSESHTGNQFAKIWMHVGMVTLGGKKLRDIPIIIIEYAIKGKIQNNFLAFSFPTHITKVFLPFDLSASWSGKEAINNTNEDNVPITTFLVWRE